MPLTAFVVCLRIDLEISIIHSAISNPLIYTLQGYGMFRMTGKYQTWINLSQEITTHIICKIIMFQAIKKDCRCENSCSNRHTLGGSKGMLT